MIWVSSSAVLVVVCALSLFWVVPRLQRRGEAPAEEQAEVAGAGPVPEDLPAPIEHPAPASRRRRNIMATTDTVPRPADGDPGHAGRGPLRIKRDRAGILLAGTAALLAALVTAVLAPFSAAVSWPWPVFLLLLATGSVLSLRYLAVQDRAVRRTSRPAVRAPEAEPHAPREDVALFDNEFGNELDDEHAVSEEVREPSRPTAEDLDLPAAQEQPRTPAPAAFTVEELRAEALRVARESAPAVPGRAWQPVPVPRPAYAEAAVVQRPEPEPLPVPEQPTSRSASLKDAVRTGEEQGRAALDLDDVLKRRRA